jgi:phosphatidylinositol 4-phosphatase
MICAGLTLPRSSGLSPLSCMFVEVISEVFTDYSLFYYFMFWFTFVSLSLLFIFIHGIDYVSWPRLIPPTDAIYYNGPGFRSGNNGKGLGHSGGSLNSKANARWLSTGRKRTGSHVGEIELGTKTRVD